MNFAFSLHWYLAIVCYPKRMLNAVENTPSPESTFVTMMCICLSDHIFLAMDVAEDANASGPKPMSSSSSQETVVPEKSLVPYADHTSDDELDESANTGSRRSSMVQVIDDDIAEPARDGDAESLVMSSQGGNSPAKKPSVSPSPSKTVVVDVPKSRPRSSPSKHRATTTPTKKPTQAKIEK